MRQLFDRDTWNEIFQSIRKNRLRTFLTMIGVFIGIYIFIGLSGASKGLDNGFEREFKDVARNSMFVWAQNTSKPYGGFKTGRLIRLRLSDAEALRKQIPEISRPKKYTTEGALSMMMILNNLGKFVSLGNVPKENCLKKKKHL